MGIEKLAGLLIYGADGGDGAGIIQAEAVEHLLGGGQAFIVQGDLAGFLESRHLLSQAGAVAPIEVEQEAFEVARHLDIHARRQGRLDLAPLERAGLEEARKDVVAIRRQNQVADGQPHGPRRVASVNIAEIAGRDGEGDFLLRRAERRGGGEVIDGLAEDSRPIDRIDAGQARVRAETMVVEHALHQSLTIVEGALDRDVVDVGGGDRRHLAALDLGDPALGMEDEDLDRGAVAAGLDGGGAGIAGSGDDDGHALTTPREHMIEQPAEDLHGVVLERQRRAVEELHQPFVGADFPERRHRRMVEARVSALDDAGQGVGLDRALDEGRHHPQGDIGIREPGEGADFVMAKPRPGFGHVEAAVTGEPGEQDFIEAKGFGRPPCTDITQSNPSNRKITYRTVISSAQTILPEIPVLQVALEGP